MSDNYILQAQSEWEEPKILEEKKGKQIDILEIEFEEDLEKQQKSFKEKRKEKKIRKLIALRGQQKAKQAAILARERSYSHYGHLFLR